jgi:hypothetical protein
MRTAPGFGATAWLTAALVAAVALASAYGQTPGRTPPVDDDARTAAGRGDAARSPTPALKASDEAAILDRWGITIEGMRLTAGGYMLDFRYRVVDPDKAAPLFERRTRPVLTDESTGVVMAVPVPPKTGPLRSSNDPKAGKTYFMFFGNPRQMIGKHRRVTVTIGDFTVSGLIVR